MVLEGDLISGGGHMVHYADRISWKCTLETYTILLMNFI